MDDARSPPSELPPLNQPIQERFMTTKLRLLGSLILLAACAHKPVTKDSVAPPAPSTTSAADVAAAGGQSFAGLPASCRDDVECPSKNLCLNGHCVLIHAGLAECSLVRVHFDFGLAELKAEEYPVMDRMARCLKADHAMKLDVRGNADERGTQEYNLALGDKRARVVARYLENQSVSEIQLNTVSFGEERPLCTEHNEACWQRNRRSGLAPK